jgi:hypothetical protein
MYKKLQRYNIMLLYYIICAFIMLFFTPEGVVKQSKKFLHTYVAPKLFRCENDPQT